MRRRRERGGGRGRGREISHLPCFAATIPSQAQNSSPLFIFPCPSCVLTCTVRTVTPPSLLTSLIAVHLLSPFLSTCMRGRLGPKKGIKRLVLTLSSLLFCILLISPLFFVTFTLVTCPQQSRLSSFSLSFSPSSSLCSPLSFFPSFPFNFSLTSSPSPSSLLSLSLSRFRSLSITFSFSFSLLEGKSAPASTSTYIGRTF
mmetsp:Transcript_18688/g.47251  ORF Transcript_18688/g.47251 Transcript_18688/m.47251 type:complete len:201 (-) Transcript_18688:389-991(-)